MDALMRDNIYNYERPNNYSRIIVKDLLQFKKPLIIRAKYIKLNVSLLLFENIFPLLPTIYNPKMLTKHVNMIYKDFVPYISNIRSLIPKKEYIMVVKPYLYHDKNMIEKGGLRLSDELILDGFKPLDTNFILRDQIPFDKVIDFRKEFDGFFIDKPPEEKPKHIITKTKLEIQFSDDYIKQSENQDGYSSLYYSMIDITSMNKCKMKPKRHIHSTIVPSQSLTDRDISKINFRIPHHKYNSILYTNTKGFTN